MQTQENYRDKISTVDDKGKRIWIYPKKPQGKFYQYRKYLSYVLLVFLFSGPYIKINGEPLLLLDILSRKFVFFGKIFWPQDFYLAVFTFVISIISIALFTVVFGRLFCGWICPQTIFMEMVFRRIEYWLEGDAPQQKALNKAPWNARKIWIKTLKQVLFFIVSFIIANTFLGYLIGGDALIQNITGAPSENLGTFSAIVIFSGVFYGVFAFMREQVCTTVCPYGRLQGVMVDQNTYTIAYDYTRGEKRGKLKDEDRGDCIDCKLCVQVCPTGIDIRNGTQLECVSCTACIDACDAIMEKVNQPKGLIRYTSESAIAKKEAFRFSARAKAYSVLLVVLMVIFGFLVASRKSVEVNLLRAYGTTFEIRENGSYLNVIQFDLLNKTNSDLEVSFSLKGSPEGNVEIIGDTHVVVLASKKHSGSMLIELPPNEVKGLNTPLEVMYYINGKKTGVEQINFSGPFKIQ